MRFDCDKHLYKQEWHRWFAWYPVKVKTHDCRWLEYIDRKVTYRLCYDGWDKNTEYRAIG
jgi:hypothetical protein